MFIQKILKYSNILVKLIGYLAFLTPREAFAEQNTSYHYQATSLKK